MKQLSAEYCPVLMFPAPAPTIKDVFQFPSAKIFLFLCIEHQIGGLRALPSLSPSSLSDSTWGLPRFWAPGRALQQESHLVCLSLHPAICKAQKPTPLPHASLSCSFCKSGASVEDGLTHTSSITQAGPLWQTAVPQSNVSLPVWRVASPTYLPLHRQVLSGRQPCLSRMSHCLE